MSTAQKLVVVEGTGSYQTTNSVDPAIPNGCSILNGSGELLFTINFDKIFSNLTTEQIEQITNNMSLTQIITNLTPTEQAALCQAIIDAGCNLTELIDLTELLTNLTPTEIQNFTNAVDFTTLVTNLTPTEQAALCQAIIDAGCNLTELVDLTELLTNLTPTEIENFTNAVDFTTLVTNLTPTEQAALCQAIIDAGCNLTELVDLTELLTNLTPTEIQNFTNAVDFTTLVTNLTPTEQAALCQAIIDAGCNLTELVDITELLTNLTPQEIETFTNTVDLTQLISNLTPAEIEDLCNALNVALTVTTGPDADPANATSTVVIDICGGEAMHIYSPDASMIVGPVAPGSVKIPLVVDDSKIEIPATQVTVTGPAPATNVEEALDSLFNKTCVVSSGPPEAITQASTTLSDGTVVNVTHSLGTNIDYAASSNGDIRWDGNGLVITTSTPSRLILTPTTNGDPVILDPNVWVYQNGTSPNNPSSTRLETNGDDVMVIPGSVGLIIPDGQFARSGLPSSSGVTASSDWGMVIANNGTQFTIRARQTDAMNIQVQPLTLKSDCEILTEHDIAITNLGDSVEEIQNELDNADLATLVDNGDRTYTFDNGVDTPTLIDVESLDWNRVVNITNGAVVDVTGNPDKTHFVSSVNATTTYNIDNADITFLDVMRFSATGGGTAIINLPAGQNFNTPEGTVTSITVNNGESYTFQNVGGSGLQLVNRVVAQSITGWDFEALSNTSIEADHVYFTNTAGAHNFTLTDGVGVTNGDEFLVQVDPQANVGPLTLNLTNIVDPAQGSGAISSITLNAGESIRFHKRTNNLFYVVNKYPVSSVDITNITDNAIFNGSGPKVAVFNGDIDVTGTIDPDGIVFTQLADTTAARLHFESKGYVFDNTIWVNTTDGHIYRGISDLEVSAQGIPGNELPSDETLNTDQLGEAYKVTNDSSPMFTSTVAVVGDVDHNEKEGLLITVPSKEFIPGTLVLVADQPDNAPNTEQWTINPNVDLRRGPTGGLYNAAAGQTSWSGGNATNTLWRNDTNTTPTGFQNSYDGAIGDFILDPAYDNVYVTDTGTGLEYGPFTFTHWQDGGGGGFAVSNQMTTPEQILEAWEVIDPRPEVRTGTFSSFRQRNLSNVTTVLNVAGDFTPGQGGNTGLTIQKFNNGFSGQSYVGLNTDQDFFFDPVLMSRIVVRAWNDTNSGDVDIRLTISNNGFNATSVTQTISQPGGGGNVSANFDFPIGEYNQVKLEIISGRWRALGVNHQLEAPTFNIGGYQGAHDVLHLINSESELPLYVNGVEEVPGLELEPKTTIQIARTDGLWYAEPDIVEGEVGASYVRTVQGVTYDLTQANFGNATLLSILADGPLVITHRDGISPLVNTTTSLADGEIAYFGLSTVLGWIPLRSAHGTVTTDTFDFVSTNMVKVDSADHFIKFPDQTTYAIPSVAEYNEFANNYRAHYVALSYEAAGGANVRVNVNGVPTTYTDLLNASDAGNGQVNFAGGANGNFNRRARVSSEVLREVGDYIEIINPDVAPFSQMIIALTTDSTDLAHTTSGVYNFRVAAGQNGTVENYSFRDKTNSIVNSGSETNAVYRITRTLSGVSFSRNGIELYCTDITEFIDYAPKYEDFTVATSTTTGINIIPVTFSTPFTSVPTIFGLTKIGNSSVGGHETITDYYVELGSITTTGFNLVLVDSSTSSNIDFTYIAK